MLRPSYQLPYVQNVYNAWNHGARAVMGTLPTGGGKTTCFAHILKELNGCGGVIAHRQELVSQISLALNREKLPHGIIGQKEVIRQIVSLHMDHHGQSFYTPRADVRVASVDTLISRDAEPWNSYVKTLVIDEGHHCLRANKWGKAAAMFPNARILLPTAHAERGDGAGLGAGENADGIVNQLIVGPTARELINEGYLSDYRLIAPPSDIDTSSVHIGPSGEFNQKELSTAVHKSKTIVGDVVSHYIKFAAGKLGLTFAVDVEAANEFVRAYNAAGVPAALITADTPIHIRSQIMRRFRKRELLQLVSVDVLGEGTDVPAVEVISMARHTASFQLYAQMFGRGLRICISEFLMSIWDTLSVPERLHHISQSVKPCAIIIDHVNNYQRHGLPDKPRSYSLDKRERKSRKEFDPDDIPLRTCLNPECFQPYERTRECCPYCGTPVPPVGRRSAPEHVDGDLFELDAATLATLRGEVARIDGAPIIPFGATAMVASAVKKRWKERQSAQQQLREQIQLWAGYQAHLQRTDAEIYKLFFWRFKMDMATACALNTQDAGNLWAEVVGDLISKNVVQA